MQGAQTPARIWTRIWTSAHVPNRANASRIPIKHSTLLSTQTCLSIVPPPVSNIFHCYPSCTSIPDEIFAGNLVCIFNSDFLKSFLLTFSPLSFFYHKIMCLLFTAHSLMFLLHFISHIYSTVSYKISCKLYFSSAFTSQVQLGGYDSPALFRRSQLRIASGAPSITVLTSLYKA